MAPTMCQDPRGTRWGSWFWAILCDISSAYLVFMRSAYFLKCRTKLTCLAISFVNPVSFGGAGGTVSRRVDERSSQTVGCVPWRTCTPPLSASWILCPSVSPGHALYDASSPTQTLCCSALHHLNKQQQPTCLTALYPRRPERAGKHSFTNSLPSVLWRCWLGGRKGIRPVKNWVVGCWRGYQSGVRCRLAYGPADATATHRLLLQ